MNISILRKQLTNTEVSNLIEDNKHFPHLTYVSRDRWLRFASPYILNVDGEFAGVCAICEFGEWVKIGPIELLCKYHGKGLGRYLLEKVCSDYSNGSIFVASSNPSVKHIVESLEFQMLPNILAIPWEVKLFLLRQLHEHLSPRFIIDGFTKKFFQSRPDLKWYIKKQHD